MTNFHDRFVYSNDFDDLVVNDKLKYENEQSIFTREIKSVQQSYSQSQIVFI